MAPTVAEDGALFGSSYGTRCERLNVCMEGWGNAGSGHAGEEQERCE